MLMSALLWPLKIGESNLARAVCASRLIVQKDGLWPLNVIF